MILVILPASQTVDLGVGLIKVCMDGKTPQIRLPIYDGFQSFVQNHLLPHFQHCDQRDRVSPMPNKKHTSWLKYGVDREHNLVRIEDVARDKTQLTCPYCGGGLTGKKGKVKAYHFAHAKESCYSVAKNQPPTLPL
jgi:hypothetical protein